jgi:hypothetical protein
VRWNGNHSAFWIMVAVHFLPSQNQTHTDCKSFFLFDDRFLPHVSGILESCSQKLFNIGFIWRNRSRKFSRLYSARTNSTLGKLGNSIADTVLRIFRFCLPNYCVSLLSDRLKHLLDNKKHPNGGCNLKTKTNFSVRLNSTDFKHWGSCSADYCFVFLV